MRKFTALLITMMLLLPCCTIAEEVLFSDEILDASDVTVIELTPTPIPKQVHIQWEGGKLPSAIEAGTTVKIVSRLTGFDNVEELRYEWEVDRHDGNGFVVMAGETKAYLAIRVTKESLSYNYRLVVYWK